MWYMPLTVPRPPFICTSVCPLTRENHGMRHPHPYIAWPPGLCARRAPHPPPWWSTCPAWPPCSARCPCGRWRTVCTQTRRRGPAGGFHRPVSSMAAPCFPPCGPPCRKRGGRFRPPPLSPPGCRPRRPCRWRPGFYASMRMRCCALSRSARRFCPSSAPRPCSSGIPSIRPAPCACR